MTNNPSDHISDPIKQAFDEGKIIIYPTEAVMGIGCDPDNEQAVMALLALKQRSVDKGLILVGASYSQLLPYVNDKLIPEQRRPEIFSSWPGPVTWLLPKSKKTPVWVSGVHDSIATRVPSFQPLVDLCHKLGKPIVSTSANLSGEPSCISIAEAKQQFGDKAIYVEGKVQGKTSPSTIKDALTGHVIRGN